MDITCLVLYLIFVVSIFVTSFSAFHISPPIRNWIDRFLVSTESGLTELANLSDKQALKAFSLYLGATAVMLLVIFGFTKAYINKDASQTIAVCVTILGYTALSINAWSNKREEILENFAREAIKDSKRFVKYFIVFSIVMTLIVSIATSAIGTFAYSVLEPLAFFFVAGIFIIFASIAIASSISLSMVFGPALVAIAYLWLSIFVARGALLIGRNTLKNLLVGYCIFGTLYATAIGFPTIKNTLNIPSICQ